jgi:hypothetical protein
MDNVRLNLPQSAPNQQGVHPENGGTACAAKVFQQMERNAVALERKTAGDVLAQNNDVDAKRRIPFKFTQEHHFPRGGMLAGEMAERFRNVCKPFDWEIRDPGDS